MIDTRLGAKSGSEAIFIKHIGNKLMLRENFGTESQQI